MRWALVPALLAGGKVIVSTGTKTLQDQLFDRDLPAVREALASAYGWFTEGFDTLDLREARALLDG
jgi:Rad3-related DNA helicase